MTSGTQHVPPLSTLQQDLLQNCVTHSSSIVLCYMSEPVSHPSSLQTWTITKPVFTNNTANDIIHCPDSQIRLFQYQHIKEAWITLQFLNYAACNSYKACSNILEWWQSLNTALCRAKSGSLQAGSASQAHHSTNASQQHAHSSLCTTLGLHRADNSKQDTRHCSIHSCLVLAGLTQASSGEGPTRLHTFHCRSACPHQICPICNPTRWFFFLCLLSYFMRLKATFS